MLFVSPVLDAKKILLGAVTVHLNCAKTTRTWERNMSRKIMTTRTVYQRFNPKIKGDGDQRTKKEVGNPVMGVMWLTMGKVMFTPLLAAGAIMSAGGVTL